MSNSDAFFEAAYGTERYQHVKNALTKPSAISTFRVNPSSSSTKATSSSPSPLNILNQEIAPLNDRLLQQNRPPYTVHTHPNIPNCLVIPSAPTVTLENTLPVVGEIVVDRRAAEAILCGSDLFAKGVLACTRPIPPLGSAMRILAVLKTRAPRGGTPQEFIEKEREMNSPVIEIGIGILKLNRHQLFHEEMGIAVEMYSRSNNISDAPPMNELIKRLNQQSLPFSYFAQTLPSMVASLALDVKEGDMVLDCCASPGGKTTHLAGLLNGKGMVVAIDKTSTKTNKVKQLVASMGYSNVVQPLCGNTTTIVDSEAGSLEDLLKEVKVLEASNNESIIRIAKSTNKSDTTSNHTQTGKKRKRKQSTKYPTTSYGLKPESFDKILLDAPCSAIGQRPRLVSTASTTLDRLAQCADYQMVLMRAAVELLKVGGDLGKF